MRAFPKRDILILVAPAVLLVLLLYLAPLAMNGALSLFRWTAARPDLEFIGLGNYQTLDELGLLIPTVLRTIVFAIAAAALMVIVPLALALAVESNTRGNRILRTIFVIPILLSPLAVHAHQPVVVLHGERLEKASPVIAVDGFLHAS